MERVKERLEIAHRALATLCELRDMPFSKLVRDAAIQRFEYTFEAVWKAAQQYLRDREGLEPGSPKGVIRACLQVGLLDETQTRLALAMVDDRTLTTHTYNESLANAIFSRINGYADLMQAWLRALDKKL